MKAGAVGTVNRPEFLYWVNQKSNDITIFAVDSTTGCLAPVGNPVSTGTGPISVMAHPDPTKRLLFVGCTSGEILPYFMDPQGTGTLRAAPSSQNVSTIGAFAAMKFRPDGQFLYVLTNDAGQKNAPSLTSYSIDTTTGALSLPANQPGKAIQSSLQLAPPVAGLKAFTLTIDTMSQYAYVALSDNRIVAVSLENTGNLSIVQNTAAGTAWVQGAPEPSCLLATGNFLFEGSQISSDLDFFSAQAGQLGINNNTYATGGQKPVAMAVPVTGGFLFCANGQSGDVSQFTLSATNGVLGPAPLPPPVIGGVIANGAASPAAALAAITINGTGSFAYTLDDGGQNSFVSAYAIDKNGLLSPATASGAATAAGQTYANVQQGSPCGGTPNPDAITVCHTN